MRRLSYCTLATGIIVDRNTCECRWPEIQFSAVTGFTAHVLARVTPTTLYVFAAPCLVKFVNKCFYLPFVIIFLTRELR